ncbi:MAG: hypothetical protein IPG77_25520 [Betaproteobacteria bacterium]|nr:hypothetical protein [Betaproteobacteria bacterium]
MANPYGYGQIPNAGVWLLRTADPRGFVRGGESAGARMPSVQMPTTPTTRTSGRQSQGIQGAPAVMQYAQQAQYNNPYLGQQSERSQAAGQNAYAGPKQVPGRHDRHAAGDMTGQLQPAVVPELDQMAQQSGSFGNSGVQQVQNEAYRDLGENIGNVSNQMRFQDYTTQQGLAESSLNRGQANNQFNAGMSANDLSRNMAGGFQQNAQNNNYLMQGAMFDAGNNLQGQMFNSTLGNNDLTRNANLAQAQGQFNTGALNTNSMFNAGNMNQNSMFNSGQGNAMNMFNAGAGNNMLENYRNRQQNQGQFDASLGNNRYQFDQSLGSNNRQFDANLGNNRYQFDQSLGSQNRQFDATLGQNQYQFDQNLDRGIWNDNMGWANQGFQNTRGLMNDAYNWAGGGVNATTAEQNTPMNYWQQFANAGNAAGGQGGTATNSQNMQGNPYLGAWAGWNMFAPKP